jgi:hypothetical protein
MTTKVITHGAPLRWRPAYRVPCWTVAAISSPLQSSILARRAARHRQLAVPRRRDARRLSRAKPRIVCFGLPGGPK